MLTNNAKWVKESINNQLRDYCNKKCSSIFFKVDCRTCFVKQARRNGATNLAAWGGAKEGTQLAGLTL